MAGCTLEDEEEEGWVHIGRRLGEGGWVTIHCSDAARGQSFLLVCTSSYTLIVWVSLHPVLCQNPKADEYMQRESSRGALAKAYHTAQTTAVVPPDVAPQLAGLLQRLGHTFDDDPTLVYPDPAWSHASRDVMRGVRWVRRRSCPSSSRSH